MRSRDQRRVLQMLGELRCRLPEGNARRGSLLISYFYRKCNGQFPAGRTEHVNMKKRISDRSAAKERFENT